MVSVCLTIWEAAGLFCRVRLPVCIPTRNIGEFWLLCMLADTSVHNCSGHSDRYAIVFHQSFNLHFSNGRWYCISFQMLNCLLYILLWSVQNSCSLFKDSVIFLLLSFEISLCILTKSSLLNMWFASTLSQSFFLLTVSFTE